jgi:hypothetical protein
MAVGIIAACPVFPPWHQGSYCSIQQIGVYRLIILSSLNICKTGVYFDYNNKAEKLINLIKNNLLYAKKANRCKCLIKCASVDFLSG